MAYLSYLLLATVSLFLIVSPITAVPLFLGMTPNDTTMERLRAARLACTVGALVLVFFALAGPILFRLLGITSPAFEVAGGILIFLIALEMLFGKEANSRRITEEEQQVAVEKEDIAVTPLAIPILCGPGSISTAILLRTQAPDWTFLPLLLVGIATVYLAAYFILFFSAHGAGRLSPLLLRVIRRLMGLLLAAVAVQFVFNGAAAAVGPFFAGN
ncbi:MAG: MarC family protein [Opitutales bacterium]